MTKEQIIEILVEKSKKDERILEIKCKYGGDMHIITKDNDEYFIYIEFIQPFQETPEEELRRMLTIRFKK